MKPTETERFWAKVNKTSTCWLWTGCIQGNGYPRFRAGGRTVYAHRYSYVLHKGPIPAPLQLDHLCRTPACVNPDHLEAVTNRENTVRGGAPAKAKTTVHIAQRHAVAWYRGKTVCAQGHPYDAANTRYSVRGTRYCAQCGRDRARDYGRRKRAEGLCPPSP